MKISVKNLDFDKAMAKKRPAHKKPKKIGIFWRCLIRLLSVFGMMGTKFRYTSERMELLEQMEQYIFGGGIYGNTENRVMISRSEKKNLPYICSRLILPYSRMKYEYPVLKKHPILLPVCHVRRWSRLLSGNTSKRICSELKLSSSVTDERRTEVRQMLDALGLK